MVSVADCERVQTEWFLARARYLDGDVWQDGPLQWVDGPDGQNLLFPVAMTVDAVTNGVRRARERGHGIVGAWLGLEVDPAPLAQAGFERGWAPWWMSAQLAEVPVPVVARACVSERYRLGASAWHAEANDGGRVAGRAWSFLPTAATVPTTTVPTTTVPTVTNGTETGPDAVGDTAGVFDMDVWPPFRRRGLGRALLAAVCAAAREAGATQAVLNATPDGKRLYDSCGFVMIGGGITWWHHLGS